jgi:DNA-binding IscR family transcriptional regulator
MPSSGAEGARRVLAVLQAFSPIRHTLTARDLTDATSIPLPSMYRYIALLRDTGLLVGGDRGAYRLSPRLISLARAAEAAETAAQPGQAEGEPAEPADSADIGDLAIRIEFIAIIVSYVRDV